ncbi:MAG TPA: amidohydrolase family protein, partial [Steroidobacteraceae bacterium]|nr:amidohydrolase family protein [Steroidobacteraceae bacterium]
QITVSRSFVQGAIMKASFVQAVSMLIGLSLAVTARAQVTDKGELPQQIAVRAARLIDVRAGKVVDDAVVLLEGDRIKSVGANLTVPSNARTIDLGDVTLLPGLIDAHTHMLHQYYRESGDDNANRILEMVQMGPAKRALLGAKIAREMLEAGFTTVRDLGNSSVNGDVALRDAINAGWVIGPRVFASTRALAPVGGQFQSLTPEAQKLIEQEYVPVSGAEEARRAVRQAIYDGADCIKVIVNSGSRVLSLEEMKVIVEEAHRANRRVAAHATDGDAAALIAAEAGVDSIEHAYTISEKVLNLMAEKKIFLVPTDASGVERYQARIKRAIKAGVRIAIGSDLYYQYPGKTRGQVAAGMYNTYVVSGMSTMEVLRAATINPADLIDTTQSVGAIESGRMADVIAVRGDVLKDITNLLRVEFVMKGGQVIKDNISSALR